MNAVVCENCGQLHYSSYDRVELDYGVRVEFESGGNEEFENRMAFINNEAMVSVRRKGELVMEFKCENAYVDSMSTLVYRMICLAESMEGGEESKALRKCIETLKQVAEDGVVEIRVDDRSGYSRICRQNIEYTEIEDVEVEDLEEERCVRYEKYSTKKEGNGVPDEIMEEMKVKMEQYENEI
ncbi:hypothetical protein ECANGB1_1309 [Enterospora canceri]|uniref:Uncharacterized protein n=1 Tax=Enterospora canceri TaxID=1081671 RepID=A0A1Y1S678_9MICR|nr:hypothetical protein ECANGB1_1309 [Enterospora canceri]